jgi:hypothetical protein
MSNPSKQKGTTAETAVVRWFQGHGWPRAERRALSGAYDMGDINLEPGIVVEVKNTKTITLAEFVAETERERINANAEFGMCVIKKRGTTDPGQFYAVTSLDQMAWLLRAAGYGHGLWSDVLRGESS